MLNARKGSTPLSYQIQPGAQYLYDYVTRRAVRYVETVVPTLKDGTTVDIAIPADRFYANLGAAASNSHIPAWMGSTSGSATFAQWDATRKQQYMRLANAGGSQLGGVAIPAVIHPGGPFGASTSYAPKNADVAGVRLRFTARFNANADYTTKGIGGNNGSASEFSTATNHFIQVLRNSGNWELGSCDGSTISQSASSGGADGSFHEFLVRWVTGEVRLYVDEVLMITKTTNLPTRPLSFVGNTADATNTIDIVDCLIDWELA